MFVILAYDVNKKRVGKVLKVCRKYLVHIQRSVFEGQITEKQLKNLKRELFQIIKVTEDSICIYSMNSPKYSMKEQIGLTIDNSHIF